MLQLALVLLDPPPCEIDARAFMWPSVDILLWNRVHEMLLDQAIQDQQVSMEKDGLDLRGMAVVLAVPF